MKSIDGFHQTSERFPNRPAVIVPDGTTYSFAEVDRRATKLANALNDRLGDARSASLLENNIPAIDLYVGGQKRGVAHVPLNTRSSPEDQQFMMENAGAEILVYDEKNSDQAAKIFERSNIDRGIQVGTSSPDIDSDVEPYEQVLESGSGEPAEVQREPAEAGIVYTSGTTGRPKGVLIDQETAWYTSTENIIEFSYHPQDRALVTTPFFHVVTPHTWVMPHFQAGSSVVLQPSFDPVETLHLIEEFEVTDLLAVPAQLRGLLDVVKNLDVDLSSLALIRSGGARISSETVEAIQEHLSEGFYNTYGCTEGTGNILYSYPFEQEQYPGTTGRPGHGYTVRVVKAAKPSEEPDPSATIEPGEEGEILVRGPSVSDGYLDRPKAQERLFVDGWLRPGDIAHLDEEGNLEIVDRIDNMIVSGGENIYPQKVEEVLSRHRDVEDVAVIGLPDETWGEAVTAIIVGDVLAEELEGFCKSHDDLADYMRPRRYKFADELPRSPVGKLRRGVVNERFSI